MIIRIDGGTVFDPVNGVDGVVGTIWVSEGKIVARQDRPADRVIDASGLVIMPGGVDLHTHIAGPKVNAARGLRSIGQRVTKPIHRTTATRSGTGGSVPSTFATGYLYAGLGYTTAIDAAIPPLAARHAHLEFADTPSIDTGMLLSLGDHHFGLECIAAGDQARLKEFVAWVLRSTQAFGVKLVNPGGIEVYKQSRPRTGIEDPVAPYGITPRQILSAYAAAVDDLKLPHPVHVHCPDLGIPGNFATTLAGMKALDGRRGHFTHIQFHSYGGDRADPGSYVSRTADLVDYVTTHPELTVDVGQVLFGDTTALTGDGAVGHYLHAATGRRWEDFDTECEAGCGIVPITYRKTALVHALQWAVGLEWFLLMRDPWRVAMTTDHPNGAAFVAYPQIVHWLMRRDARREVLRSLPEEVRRRTELADLDREYTLTEIAIITRAGPARILGLPHKGHLGIGADADVTIYTPSDDIAAMFTLPRYVLKAGEVIVEDGEVRQTVFGPVQTVEPDFDAGRMPGLKEWFERKYTVRFANYAVGAHELGHGRRVVNSRATV